MSVTSDSGRTAPRSVLAWTIALTVCAWLSPASAAAATQGPHLNPWPAGAPSPDFRLMDPDGHLRTIRSFHGNVAVVTFGYANCPSLCSLELQKLASAVHSLGRQGASVRVIFVTLDPERDTPAALAKFVHAFDPGFIGLRGTPRQTDAATRRFTLDYARLPGKQNYLIDHPVEEFVFDGGGRLRLVGGSNTSVDDLVHDLSALVKDSRGAAR